MSKLPGKKRFKNTEFGARALAGARSGTGGIENPDGTRSSVRTATYDIPGKRPGSTDVMVAPTIRMNRDTGQLEVLDERTAFLKAIELADFLRIIGGDTPEAVEKARAKGDARSRKFSARLGKISASLSLNEILGIPDGR